jgi:hypothetical protein
MRHSRRQKALCGVSLVALLFFAGQVLGQGYGGPLTVEGLHQQDNPSAAARGFGGVTIGGVGNIGLMFTNPASMQALRGMKVTVGGFRQYQDLRQEQHFAPVRYYPNLSLLLEGLTDPIPDPDPELVGFTPADSVQRPFDDIRPFWSRSNTSNVPLQALVAVPMTLGGVTLIGGVGMVQYANLNHYYQNNNVLDPAVLSQRPLPILRPTDNNPVTANWYQSLRSREGQLYGYGAALAASIDRYNLTIALSGLFLKGSSDDFEQQNQRGTLTFFANEFRANSSFGRRTKAGTSEFSGQEFSIGSTLHGRYVDVGFVVRPPTTFTRAYEMELRIDTTGTPVTSVLTGEDQMGLPWRGSAGVMLKPRDNLKIGLEYEIRPYGSATFTTPAGAESSPWHSSSLLRMGVEYEPAPWLVVRSGLRGEADVFVPEGSPIEGEPVTFSVYTAGFGLGFAGIRWNMAYEYAGMKYQDIWGSSLSINRDSRHTIIADISITIPMSR